MAAMELSPFDPSYADHVAAWPVDADECRAWCSAPSVDGGDVVAWSSDPSVEAWAKLVDGLPVGYGEAWFDEVEQEAELARVIVAPAWRSTGLGRLRPGDRGGGGAVERGAAGRVRVDAPAAGATRLIVPSPASTSDGSLTTVVTPNRATHVRDPDPMEVSAAAGN
jgi:Acetyltransferase (GNAT) family